MTVQTLFLGIQSLDGRWMPKFTCYRECLLALTVMLASGCYRVDLDPVDKYLSTTSVSVEKLRFVIAVYDRDADGDREVLVRVYGDGYDSERWSGTQWFIDGSDSLYLKTGADRIKFISPSAADVINGSVYRPREGYEISPIEYQADSFLAPVEFEFVRGDQTYAFSAPPPMQVIRYPDDADQLVDFGQSLYLQYDVLGPSGNLASRTEMPIDQEPITTFLKYTGIDLDNNIINGGSRIECFDSEGDEVFFYFKNIVLDLIHDQTYHRYGFNIIPRDEVDYSSIPDTANRCTWFIRGEYQSFHGYSNLDDMAFTPETMRDIFSGKYTDDEAPSRIGWLSNAFHLSWEFDIDIGVDR